MAIQETKQKTNEILEMDGYTFFNIGGENRMLWTGLFRGKKLKAAKIKRNEQRREKWFDAECRICQKKGDERECWKVKKKKGGKHTKSRGNKY